MWSCLSCSRYCRPSVSLILVWSAWIGLWAYPTLVLGTCGFTNFPSISATVNKTVIVECRSNCTPIRILHIVGDSEDEVDSQTQYSNEGYPYITIATIHLDLTYNETYLVCKAVNEQSSTDLAQILLQDFLQPVENLKANFNATHIRFQWQGPPVLPGVKLRYHVHLFREGTIVFNETVTQNFFIVSFNCPCQPSCFEVTPVAGVLVGEKHALTPNCTDDDPDVSIDSEGFRKHSAGNRKVRIAFKIKTYNSWCIPSAAIMTAFCQHTDTTVTNKFRHFKSEDIASSSS